MTTRVRRKDWSRLSVPSVSAFTRARTFVTSKQADAATVPVRLCNRTVVSIFMRSRLFCALAVVDTGELTRSAFRCTTPCRRSLAGTAPECSWLPEAISLGSGANPQILFGCQATLLYCGMCFHLRMLSLPTSGFTSAHMIHLGKRTLRLMWSRCAKAFCILGRYPVQNSVALHACCNS